MRCPSCKEEFKKFLTCPPYDLHCPLCNFPGLLQDFLALEWSPEARKMLVNFTHSITCNLSEWVEVLANNAGESVIKPDTVKEFVSRFPNERFKEDL